MKNLVLHVQHQNALHRMWHDGDTLIIGVSGGPDSMCLLDVMTRIAHKEDLTLIVAHVNYRLRGADADADEVLVAETAHHHGLHYHVLHPTKTTRHPSENTLRTTRYTFFEKLRMRYDASAILVAHTQNDQAETILLHLLRGAGPNGLRGMSMTSPSHIARPLLDVTRDTVHDYITARRIPFRIDSTNTNPAYTRNHIRHRLIPYLARHYNPNIIATLARTAQNITHSSAPAPFWHSDRATRTSTFHAKHFIALSPDKQRHTLYTMITELCGSSTAITKNRIDELRKIITSAKPKTLQFTSKNLKLLKKNDTVYLVCTEK